MYILIVMEVRKRENGFVLIAILEGALLILMVQTLSTFRFRRIHEHMSVPSAERVQ